MSSDIEIQEENEVPVAEADVTMDDEVEREELEPKVEVDTEVEGDGEAEEGVEGVSPAVVDEIVEQDEDEEDEEEDEGDGEGAAVSPSILPDASSTPAPVTQPARLTPYKSYRKKYRKMRLRFENAMREANTSFISENQQWDVAKRLKEENDQLLEDVLDLVIENRASAPESMLEAQAIIDKRFKLSKLENDVIHTTTKLPDESILPGDLIDLDLGDADENSIDVKPKDPSLPTLTKGTYCDFDPRYTIPPAYLTPEQEESYVSELDATLSAMPSTDNLPTSVETVNPKPPPFKRVQLTEEDFSMRSPISVHNWLRRNQPQIYEEVKEKQRQKEERDTWDKPIPTRKYTKKEKVVSKQDQPFEGLDDEIGFDPTFDPPTLGSARGKKRKDDDTYRPKGGHSKGGKRKRDKDDGEVKGKAGKKARTLAVAHVEDEV